MTAPTARNMTALATIARAKYARPAEIRTLERAPDKDGDDGG